MKVLVTGATGYIGHQVARRFREEGCQVHGLTRNEKNSALLLSKEIIPIVSSLKELKLKQKEYELIIHCAFESPEEDMKAVQKLLQSSPKGFIYTSGVWVYGNQKERVEESSKRNPLVNVSWRVDVEEFVLKDSFPSIIIRPAHVYGFSKGLFAQFFAKARQGKIELIEGGENHWSQVHVSDLAELYLLSFQKGSFKEIFNASLESSVQVKHIAEAVQKQIPCQISPISLQEALQKWGPLAYGLAVDQKQISSEKANRLLNWRPKHLDFLSEIHLYARCSE